MVPQSQLSLNLARDVKTRKWGKKKQKWLSIRQTGSGFGRWLSGKEESDKHEYQWGDFFREGFTANLGKSEGI